jgi:Flp pilus assembly protein CpaB
MKTKSLILLILILITLLFVQAGAFTADLQEQDTIIAQLQQPQQRITITEPITLIRTVEDYTYLNSLEIDKDIWDNATKHTDINGVTWREIIQDGYIKVYTEGHVMPDSISLYAPY